MTDGLYAETAPERSAEEQARLMFAFSHDLRGYLRTVMTRIQLVQKTGASFLPEQETRWLNEACKAGEEMNGLVAAMVAYSTVSAAPETMGLKLMLKGLKMEHRPMLEGASADLFIAEPVEADVSRALITVLGELITNSCRFRRPEVRAEIRIVTQMLNSGQVEIVVSDNGSGVNPEYVERIFQPFRRMHSRTEYPGFGLGLALCRKILTANNGTISAQAPAEGGLSLRIVVPVASAA